MSKRLAILLLSWLVASVHAASAAPATPLVEAARAQIGVTIIYDASYKALSYPNGDVLPDRGVCTDVLIRALRTAYHFDLQQRLHEDMRVHFGDYPQAWGLKHADSNIDHRRVPNLQAFFRRKGWELPISDQPSGYLPGDIVTSLIPPHLPHIMIVSDRKSATGHPLVIHNIGAGTREEEMLFRYPITGHYRLKLARSHP
ncbi:MAG TPA: DUF1287 domain-containing protein [Gammaproteobacteria bacterium]